MVSDDGTVASANVHEVARELDLLTSAQLCEASGASYRRLDYWERTGLLVPDFKAGGSGTGRLWPHSAVPIARLLVFFGEIGLSLRGPFPDAIREAMETGMRALDWGPFRVDLTHFYG